MTPYERNRSFLHRRFPAVGAQLPSQPPTAPQPDDLGRNPEALCIRWADTIQLSERGFYAITGLRHRQQYAAVVDRLPKGAVACFLEPDIERLALLFRDEDWTDLFAHPRVLLIAGEVSDAGAEILMSVDVAIFGDAEAIRFQPAFVQDREWFTRALSEVARRTENLVQLVRANLDDSADWLSNSIQNLPFLADAPDVSALGGLLKDIPVILVGAGPSLDESFDFLRAAQDRACIICVNTAFGTLRRAGIRPHLTVAADPRATTAAGYQDVDCEDVPLACPFFVYPEIAETFAGRIFTWSENSALARWLRQERGLAPGTLVIEEGTVSACILDLARIAGSTRICLVGQDMCQREDGRNHAADTAYAEWGSLYDELEDVRRIPANTGEPVPAESKFLVFLQSFEKFVRAYPSIEIINTAARGARIDGVPYRSLAEAEAWLGMASTAHLGQRLLETARPITSGRSWESALEGLLRYAGKVLEVSTGAALFHEQLPEKLAAPSYRNSAPVRQAEAMAAEVNQVLDQAKGHYSVLFDGRLKRELQAFRRDHPDNPDASHWEILQRNRAFFWAVAEGAFFLHTEVEWALRPAEAPVAE